MLSLGTLITLAGGSASGWGAAALGLLSKIPRPVWISIGTIIAVLAYGQYTASKARQQEKLRVALEQQAERMRQQIVFNNAMIEANKRAVDATKKASELERRLNDAVEEVRKQKDSGVECLPASFIDRLRSESDKYRRTRTPKRPQ